MRQGFAAIRMASPAAAGRRAAGVWLGLASLALLAAAGVSPTAGWAQVFVTNTDVTSTTARAMDGTNESGSERLAQPFTVPATGVGGASDTGDVVLRRIRLDFDSWPSQASLGTSGIRVYVTPSESNLCTGTEGGACFAAEGTEAAAFNHGKPMVRPASDVSTPGAGETAGPTNTLAEFTPVTGMSGRVGENWFEHAGLSLQRGQTYYVLLFQNTGNVQPNQSPTWRTAQWVTTPITGTEYTYEYSPARCEASVAEGWTYSPAVSTTTVGGGGDGWIFSVPPAQTGYAHVMALQGDLNDEPVLVISPPTGGDLNAVEPRQTVTAVAVTDPNGLSASDPMITYRWQERPLDSTDDAAWQDVSPSVSSTGPATTTTPPSLTIGNDDQEKEFRLVTEEFVDDNCYANTAYSAIAKVPVANDAPEGMPTIEGTVRVGEELTAVTTGIMDADGLTGVTFMYQWRRAEDAGGTNEADISGAAAAAYTLTTADAGQYVQVVVSYTDDLGFPNSVGSAWTEVLNSDPDGVPTVSGTLMVDQELTAVTTGISDADGPDPLDFTYQWRRADDASGGDARDISGASATSSTYTLVQADAGKYVQVVASYTDGGGTEESVESAWTEVGNSGADGMPTISGTVRVGEELTAVTSGIMDADGLTGVTFMYQWRRADDGAGTGDTVISGAASPAYTLTTADAGQYVQVVVSFTDQGGENESVGSAWTEVLNSDPTGVPTVSGTLMVGQVLTAATDGISDADGPDPLASFTYQWRRADDASGANEADIPGETSATYTLVPADAPAGAPPKHIQVVVSYEDGGGTTESLESAWTAAVQRRDNMPPTGDVGITDEAATGDVGVTGTPQAGDSLAADVSDVDDPNGGVVQSSWTYQWQRADDASGTNPVDIPAEEGGTSETYMPREDDVGKYLRVLGRFTDGDGYDEGPLESEWKGPVEEAATTAEASTVRQWTALFGRTVSVQALDAVQQRLASRGRPQGQARVAGRQMSWTPGSDEDTFARGAVDSWFAGGDPRGWLDAMDSDVRSLVEQSSFAYTRQSGEGTFTSLWGRGAYMAFSGEESGGKVDGGVTTGHVGADWAFGRWFVGLSVGHSSGTGDYRDDTGDGDLSSSVTGVYPYVGYTLSERTSVWAMTGYGEGGLEVTSEDGDADKADLGVTMGATGVRGELLTGEALGGFALAVKADAVTVRVSSDRSELLEGTRSSVNRVRMGLEASGRVALGPGETLTPVLDIGVLREGGHAGSGTGVDTGIGFVHEMPACGLTIDLRGRTLSIDDVSSRDQWGLSGGIQYDAVPSGARGLSMALDVGYGGRASATGTASLFEMDTFDDLGAGSGASPSGGRVGAKIGYGLQALESRYASTPRASVGLTETGTDWTLGWWLTPAAQWAPDVRGGVEIDGDDDGRGVSLRIDARF